MSGPSRGRAVVALTLGSFSFVTAATLPIGLRTPMADGLDRSLSAIGFWSPVTRSWWSSRPCR